MQTGGTDEHQQAGGAAGKDNDRKSPDAAQHNTAAIGLIISQSLEQPPVSPTHTPNYNAEIGTDRSEANASSALLLLNQRVTVAPSGSRPSDDSADPAAAGSTASQNITVQQTIHNNTIPAKPNQSPPTATNRPSSHTPNIPIPSNLRSSAPTQLPPLPEMTSFSAAQLGKQGRHTTKPPL